ncbi:hypothetical protein COE67_17675 [Priestia megaterium]|uniref:hypothetical protein n=1 Tax=Priestia megaterium TaxID=1404 RepID=UPI000BFDF09C|nr:hypothetical protein [Priestia megaterium]PGR28516.1 hypothetical protein COC52_08175 [Priestia megaterium]PGX39423.1 hypothetical protein COE67_17675 [Priestia megaterium]
MPSNFVGEEYADQVRKMVDFDEGKSISKDFVAKQLAENNKNLTGEPVALTEQRKKFWSQAAESNLKRLVKKDVLIDNEDGTYTKK